MGAARTLEATCPGCGLIVVSEGTSADASPFGLLTDFSSSEVRYVEDGRGMIIPSGCATYLDTSASGWLQSWLGEDVLEPAGEEIGTAEGTWRFYAKPAGAWQPARAEPIAEWANGARLWDYQLQGTLAPGGPAELTLLWQATRPGDGRALHFFNHLLYASDGRLVSQQDGSGVHTPYWQPGDFLVTRFTIPIPEDAPAGQYQVRVGMYGLVDQVRVPLVGGNDALDVVAIDRSVEMP